MIDVPTMTPVITNGYIYWVERIAKTLKKHIPEATIQIALSEIGKDLGGLESQIVHDILDWQIQQEREKYGEEEFRRVNGIVTQEASEASGSDTPAKPKEVRRGQRKPRRAK